MWNRIANSFEENSYHVSVDEGNSKTVSSKSLDANRILGDSSHGSGQQDEQLPVYYLYLHPPQLPTPS